MGMKEWPILFQDRLVLANFAGRKNQTRRVGPAAKRWLRAEAGDILWVREAWRPVIRLDVSGSSATMCNMIEYRADGKHVDWPEAFADLHAAYMEKPLQDGAYSGRWRPSIHMPRAACRQLLELREKPWEEGLHDITEANAIGEGLQESIMDPGYWITINDAEKDPRDAFRVLWDSINAKREGGKYAWKRNPTVTVLSYQRFKA